MSLYEKAKHRCIAYGGTTVTAKNILVKPNAKGYNIRSRQKRLEFIQIVKQLGHVIQRMIITTFFRIKG